MIAEAGRIRRERLNVETGTPGQPVEFHSGRERRTIAVARALEAEFAQGFTPVSPVMGDGVTTISST